MDLLAVQGTLKSLLQHHSSKASILRRSAFFTVQLSHLYVTTGKTIALTRRTFVGKVMSLLLNMLSRLVIAFLPRSKRLLISWLQSPSAVICLTQVQGNYLPANTCLSAHYSGHYAHQSGFHPLSFICNRMFPYVLRCAGLSRPVVSILCNPTDCSLPVSSVHEIPQTRILEWIAISFSRGSSVTGVSGIAGRFFTI